MQTEKIQVHGRSFVRYINESELQKEIKRMASEINRDYAGKRPLFIPILNGSFMFAADLFKELTIETEVCFIKLASYHGMHSSGSVITSIGLDQNIAGRDVIILEDIVDTGKTLHEFLPQVKAMQPASVVIATLLHKPEALKHPLQLEYVGFSVPNKFLLGYGLDYDGIARNLKEIYQLDE
jgi:hypoxanthine phosphoribosyltransferase